MPPSSLYVVDRSGSLLYWLGSWHNPIISGLGLISGLIFYYLIRYEHWTFVTLISFTCILHYIPAIATRYIPRLDQWKIHDNIDLISIEHVQIITTNINYIYRVFIRIYTFQSIPKSVGILLCVGVLAYIGMYLDLLNIFLIVHIMVFSIPFIYDRYQHECDKIVDMIRSKCRSMQPFHSIQ